MTGTWLLLIAMLVFEGGACGYRFGQQADQRAAERDAAEAAEHEAYWGPIRAAFAEEPELAVAS